jgi:hypothetical protein
MTTQIKQNTSNELKTKIKIGPALGSYANIFTPRAVNEGDEPKYSISLLFDKKAIANPVTPEGKSYLELVKLVEAVALKSFGPAWKSIKGFHLPMRDGDVDKPEQKEYAGMMFVNASSKRPPGVVGKNLVPITSGGRRLLRVPVRRGGERVPVREEGEEGRRARLEQPPRVGEGGEDRRTEGRDRGFPGVR